MLATVPDARIARAGNERWLVVKATPEQAWNLTRTFWNESGFVMATEQPALGVMETDWAENRAEIPQDLLRKYVGKYLDVFYTTYKRDKFRSRIERGAEPGTVEIYISHRGMEQVPTGKIDNSSPAAFAWALMPPNPDLEAEMLTRLMVRFGTSEPQAVAAVAQASAQPERARVEKGNAGVPRLVVDETFDRAWRRVGLALDRSGFTVVDRDRSNGLYYVRYSDPDAEISERDQGLLAKLMVWR
jgi:outer membrane protein assembly factor BamC